jgi:hypothetical protein
MRIKLASGSTIETAVTLAAAALMTFAGFAMLEERIALPPAASAPAIVATPHVDAARG